MRLERALGEFAIDGVETTIPLFEKLLPNEDFRKADYDIHWLEVFLGMKEAD
jgi:acetyl-CoA carboxylase biotin carboxylase subunit